MNHCVWVTEMPEPIVIVEYNPDWPQEFEKEASKILLATGHKIVAVEHIGSTAVPGLGAKPIIDMMAAVNLIADAHDCIESLQSIGYQYTPYPDFPERLFFRDGPMGEGPHHLHVTEILSDFWNEKLLFRDFLRNDPDAAREFYVLKIRLAQQHGADREKYEPYTVAKNPFISSALSQSRVAKQS